MAHSEEVRAPAVAERRAQMGAASLATVWGEIGPAIVVAALLLALWQGLVAGGALPKTVLPGPLDVLEALVTRWTFLRANIGQTIWQTLAGLVISIVAGVGLGILIGWWEFFRRGVYPYLVVLQILPKVALAPLFVLWLGIGAPSRLLMVFTLSFFPCMVTTSLGLASIDPDLVRMARAFGGGPLDVFLRVRLPAALPAIFSGIKIAVTMSVVGIVVAEFVAAQGGLGYVIVFAQGQLDAALAFAALLLLSIFGLVLYGLVTLVERRVLYW